MSRNSNESSVFRNEGRKTKLHNKLELASDVTVFFYTSVGKGLGFPGPRVQWYLNIQYAHAWKCVCAVLNSLTIGIHTGHD